MRTLALIPARTGSKRIKNKNGRPLGPVPLVGHTINFAMACGLFDGVVLSSDGYEDIAKSYGVDYLQRPADLCLDAATDMLVIRHALAHYAWPDLIAYLRPTTPFRTAETVKRALDAIVAAGDAATGLRSVERMGESAFKAFTLLSGYQGVSEALLDPIRRAGLDMTDLPNQEVTPTYRANGYVDIAIAGVVQDGGLWGNTVIGLITPRTVEIDDEEDFEYAQYLWARRHG